MRSSRVFFATLTKELLVDGLFATRGEASRAVFEFIEIWYNRQRRHSTLGYRTPVEYDAPGSGRFTRQDPLALGGGLNIYGFAGGDPINGDDPFGLCLDGVTTVVCIVEAVAGGLTAAEGSTAVVTAEHLAAAGATVAAQSQLGLVDKIGGDALGLVEKVGSISVHGNSLLTTKLTQGYTLRDRTTGEVKKYGQTILGKYRYTQKYLKDHNLEINFETSGTKAEMRDWEHKNILAYKAAHDGNRPDLNKSDY